MRGSRILDSSEEKIADPILAAQLRRQAANIHAQALLAAALLTGFSLLLLP